MSDNTMDAMWGEQTSTDAKDGERGQLFRWGHYAMFIHWGLYSRYENKVDGVTYYGIGEWIMHPRMADIAIDRYVALAGEFNPVAFDANAIAQLAIDAGMKYIVVTSKHHEGFAMYDSACNDFNIVKATPFGRDPMKELSEACRERGLGFGFYYSHNQDWTFPGGNGGPTEDVSGKPATFDHYFTKKCLPQVEEITSNYGPIELVWFDTPGNMPKKYVQQLVDVVRRNQPKALVSGRAGHGLGDYKTLGDMQVPTENVDGLWESVDTTNDSWGFAWYDENWKTPREILRRLVGCVGRGGTYMLNIGPRADGSVPAKAARALESAGAWIRRYPQVVYGADASPWKHALPWGDVTRQGSTLSLVVFDWPTTGTLTLPGLKSEIQSVQLLRGDTKEPLTYTRRGEWVQLTVPAAPPERLATVIVVTLKEAPQVNTIVGIDPELETELLVSTAEVDGAACDEKRWMEKFGEWKHVVRVHQWEPDGRASWQVQVLEPGDYEVDLLCAGEERSVWSVDLEGGASLRNQVTTSPKYTRCDIGWLSIPAPGTYTVSVSCLDGNASLAGIYLTPVVY